MKERDLAYIALFAALIAVLGLIPKIDLMTGIPITAQSLGVMLCGTVLGARRGFLAAFLFVALVAAGLPLLSGGRGGIGMFATGSVGFLIGFPFAALAAGLIMERVSGSVLIVSAVGAAVGGILVLYAFAVPGVAWVGEISLREAAVSLNVYLIGDAIKVVICALVTQAIAVARPDALLSRN